MDSNFSSDINPFSNGKEPGEDRGRQSGYGNFIEESSRITQMKNEYVREFLNLQPSYEISRVNIIKLASIMASELMPLASSSEKTIFSNDILRLREVNNQISNWGNVVNTTPGLIREPSTQKITDEKYKNFTIAAERFHTDFVTIQSRTKLGLKMATDTKDSLERALEIAKVNNKPYFPNANNILISPQLEYYCRILYLRCARNQDNVILCSAVRGSGKSTLILEMASTLATMLNMPFGMDNVFINDSRKVIINKLKEMPKYGIFIGDQAGNWFNSRQGMNGEQIDLMNALDVSRWKSRTVFLLWHNSLRLDSDLRDDVATGYITIQKQGVAIVKELSTNPYSPGLKTTKKMKNMEMHTANEAHEIISKESSSLYEIPYLPLDSNNTAEALKLWNEYSDKKAAPGDTGKRLKKPRF